MSNAHTQMVASSNQLANNPPHHHKSSCPSGIATAWGLNVQQHGTREGMNQVGHALEVCPTCEVSYNENRTVLDAIASIREDVRLFDS